MNPTLNRCSWVTDDPLYIEYHDREWGVPIYDERALFELLLLEGAQAGLSWITVLKKRENYRRALDGFDPTTIAAYDEKKLAKLLADPGLIRNRAKMAAAVTNARAYLTMQNDFSAFLWGFVGGKPQINHFGTLAEVPSETPESRAMSKALKQLGFKFVGPTICYAFMQSAGMVNDHTTDCFRSRAGRRSGAPPRSGGGRPSAARSLPE